MPGASVFAKLICGELPARFVWRGNHAVVFLSKWPQRSFGRLPWDWGIPKRFRPLSRSDAAQQAVATDTAPRHTGCCRNQCAAELGSCLYSKEIAR